MDEIEKITYDGKEDKNIFLTGIGKHDNELISLLDLNAVVMDR